MESIFIYIITALAADSGIASVILSFLALIGGAIFYFKKTKIDEYTSVGTVQHQQIDSLLEEVKLLSEELSKARQQLSEIHEQNVKLMVQIRESNLRIQELEDIIHANK